MVYVRDLFSRALCCGRIMSYCKTTQKYYKGKYNYLYDYTIVISVYSILCCK